MATKKTHEFGFYVCLIAAMLVSSCRESENGEGKLFQEQSARQTGIDFVNKIEESDQFNII
ncbi:MAG: hypothetical protein ABL895_07745, partial [Cyclobacteriaceae bacterium]